MLLTFTASSPGIDPAHGDGRGTAGHTFAAGAMLAVAKIAASCGLIGFLLFPEVDINIPFTLGMNALIMAN